MVYEVTYFNARGRGEVIRMLLCEAGQKFRDIRIEPESWDDDKRNETQTGFLPILKDGEFLMSGSLSIVRYLARQYGLLGTGEKEAALVDMVMDLLYDYEGAWSDVNWEEDEHVKAWLLKKAEGYNRTLVTLEKLLTQNRGKFFVGNKITAADIMVAANLESQRDQLKSDLHPNLIKLYDAVRSRPAINDWIEKRPVNEF